jgi:hypothetical protein
MVDCSGGGGGGGGSGGEWVSGVGYYSTYEDDTSMYYHTKRNPETRSRNANKHHNQLHAKIQQCRSQDYRCE